MLAKQIAFVFGVTEAAVSKALSDQSPSVVVPGWVPAELAQDYRRISEELGQASARRWALHWVSQ